MLTEAPSMEDYLLSIASDEGILSYAAFSEAALYAPQIGYYTSTRNRVGYTPGADFYTAQSLGPVFSQLVENACSSILGKERLQDFHFIELAAEPSGLLIPPGRAHPFASYSAHGCERSLPANQPNSILFANELFDAQPFHRFRYKEGTWQEVGVCIREGALAEVLLPEPTDAGQTFIKPLPQNHIEGYTLDISLEAEELLRRLVATPFSGLVLFFDYGKMWEHLLYNTPSGSARGYHKHQISDVLEHPGRQDITLHIPWDRLEGILTQQGAQETHLQTQEAFFMHHAQETIQNIIEHPGFTQDKQTLKELLAPQHMGQRFQVLWGLF